MEAIHIVLTFLSFGLVAIVYLQLRARDRIAHERMAAIQDQVMNLVEAL
jgi:hypothetical protein